MRLRVREMGEGEIELRVKDGRVRVMREGEVEGERDEARAVRKD